MATIQEYKVVIAGGSEVGKSSYVRRFCDGDFKNDYTATLGVEVHPLLFDFHSSEGDKQIQFNVWDVAGDERLRGDFPEGYNINADAAIVMYDCTKPDEANLSKYVEEILHVSPGAKIVFVANKIDLKMHEQVTIPDGMNGHFICISSKSLYDQDKPWVYLARQLEDNETLCI